MSRETARVGGALGRLGQPEVGLEGGGGTEEEGVGRRTEVPHDMTGQKQSYGGRDFGADKGMCNRRAQVVHARVWSPSTRRPIEFRAWMVEQRRGMRTDSPGERVLDSWGVGVGSGSGERARMRQVPSR